MPQKTTLTLACVYLDYRVKSQILDFNRKSSDYRIEVRDYSEFNTDDELPAYGRLREQGPFRGPVALHRGG